MYVLFLWFIIISKPTVAEKSPEKIEPKSSAPKYYFIFEVRLFNVCLCSALMIFKLNVRVVTSICFTRMKSELIIKYKQ